MRNNNQSIEAQNARPMELRSPNVADKLHDACTNFERFLYNNETSILSTNLPQLTCMSTMLGVHFFMRSLDIDGCHLLYVMPTDFEQ